MKLYQYYLLIALVFLLLFFIRLGQSSLSAINPDAFLAITGVLTSQPQLTAKSQRFNLGPYQVVTHRYPEYALGDKLQITGRLKNSLFLFPNIRKISENSHNLSFNSITILTFLNRLRQNLLNTYQTSLPQPFGGLLAGIVLGAKSSLDPQLKNVLLKTGVYHVVAASGMNVTLVTAFILQSLKIKSRQKHLLLALPIAFAYAFLAGASPPVLRAALMASIAYLALFSGRQTSSLLGLFWTAVLLLLISPRLAADLGFQLSLASVFGLITIQPIIQKTGFMARFTQAQPLLANNLATTLAAQIATFPLLFFTFGQYSILTLLANTVSIVVIEWVLILGLFIALLGLISNFLAQIAALPVLGLLWFFVKINQALAAIDFGFVQIQPIAEANAKALLTIGYYLILTGVVGLAHKRNF